MTGTR